MLKNKRDMDKNEQDKKQQTLTKEEWMRRLKASRQRKKESVETLKNILKIEYKKRTGLEATNFEVW